MVKLAHWNFKIVRMIPSHSFLPLKTQDSANPAVSSLSLNSSWKSFCLKPQSISYMRDKMKKITTPADPSWVSQERNSSSPALSRRGGIPITPSLPSLKTIFLCLLPNIRTSKCIASCLQSVHIIVFYSFTYALMGKAWASLSKTVS